MDVNDDPDVGCHYGNDHYIENCRAYTEDNILVLKLFVYKIPRKATSTDLKSYFSNYGKILDVNFLPIKRHCIGAFIHFDCPEAAAAALQAKRHYVLSKRIYVKACDSWDQPGAMCSTITDSITRGFEDVFADDSNVVLNDRCMEYIIQRLDLGVQVRFARAFTRIRQVAAKGRTLHKNLCISRLNGMTLWEIRDYFDIAGESIMRVYGELPSKHRERIVELMGSNCTGIKCVNLEYSNLRRKTLNKLVNGLLGIVQLRLHNCSLKDESLIAIRKLCNLKALNLSNNICLTGEYINNFSPSIETLSLNNCKALSGKHVVAFCESMTNLKKLDLVGCNCLSACVNESMISSCKNLEVLKISINSFNTEYEMVTRLPKLQSLTININSSGTQISDVFFNQLVEHKATSLKHFHIVGLNCINDRAMKSISCLSALRTLDCSNNEHITQKGLHCLCSLTQLEEVMLKDCCNITNSALLRLTLCCPKLQRMHVQNCANITDHLIFKLIQKMRQQIQNSTFERNEAIALMVENTKINKYILNDPEYLSSADLLRIHFGEDLFNNNDEFNSHYDDFDDAKNSTLDNNVVIFDKGDYNEKNAA